MLEKTFMTTPAASTPIAVITMGITIYALAAIAIAIVNARQTAVTPLISAPILHARVAI